MLMTQTMSASASSTTPYARPQPKNSNRSLVCDDCKRKFSRIDAKTRHLSTCPARRTTPPRAGRKVCDGCATAKARCDYGLPCSRCTTRGMDCHYSNPVNRIKKLAAMNEAPAVVASQNIPSLMPLPMQFMPMQYAVPRLDTGDATFTSLLSPSTIDAFPGLFTTAPVKKFGYYDNYTFDKYDTVDTVYTVARAASEELMSAAAEPLYSNYTFMDAGAAGLPAWPLGMSRIPDQPTSFKLSDAVLSAVPFKEVTLPETDAETTFVKSILVGFVTDLVNASPVSTFIHSTETMTLLQHPILARAIDTAREVINSEENDLQSEVRSLVESFRAARIPPDSVNAVMCAMIVYSTVARFHLDNAATWHSDLVQMSSGWNLLRSHATQQAMCTINPSHSEWQKWISYETTKRLAFGVYLLDCLYTTQTVYPAALGFELPCNDTAWMASTWLDWATSLSSSRSFEAVQRSMIGQLDDPLMQKTFDGLGRFSQILLIARA